MISSSHDMRIIFEDHGLIFDGKYVLSNISVFLISRQTLTFEGKYVLFEKQIFVSYTYYFRSA